MRPGSAQGRRSGFTLVGVLVLLALMMGGVSTAGMLLSQQVRREREQELLRVGSLYAEALLTYHDRSPGSLRQYPERLDQLLLDPRFVSVARHLRTLYPDPVNPGQPWGLLLSPDQRIVGVYSMSSARPLREAELVVGRVSLAAAKQYSDWKFTIKTRP